MNWWPMVAGFGWGAAIGQPIGRYFGNRKYRALVDDVICDNCGLMYPHAKAYCDWCGHQRHAVA